jgi:nicotinate-nucleotide--dimethylbenzimidazole phosphoribosyltransferase
MAGVPVIRQAVSVDTIFPDFARGEGTGAALAVSLLRAALACHAGMATFAEAGVADRPR